MGLPAIECGQVGFMAPMTLDGRRASRSVSDQRRPSSIAVAVVQPLPGIGDMIWHLPHIRAIAEHVGEPVTLITKPRSAADQIFSAELTVRDVFWLDRNPEGRPGEHDGGAGLFRMTAALRARRFDAVYILHHSRTIALLTLLAGIPARFGYGYGIQGWLLNRPPRLPNQTRARHPFDQATAWLQAAGIPMAEAEPILPVTEAALATVRSRLGPANAQLAIGIGSSEAYKQWGAARFAALADALAARGSGNLILVGGTAEAGLAAEIRSRVRVAGIVTAIGWELSEIAALFRLSKFYVGNDTGVMNMAAAVGIRTYCLAGAVSPMRHSSRIVAITPPGGVAKSDGMARLSVEQVLAEIETDQASSRA
jgi:heptosyltransferase-2